jgi:hypothetical protein
LQEEGKKKGMETNDGNHVQDDKRIAKRKGNHSREPWRGGEIDGKDERRGSAIGYWLERSWYFGKGDQRDTSS